MKDLAQRDDVEHLLRPEHRARLPMTRQFALYFNPFSLFKDASTGPLWSRESARAYNRASRWMLLLYVRRWLSIAALSFFGLLPAEAMAAQAPAMIIPVAGLGLGFCIAIVVALWAAAAYVMLGLRSELL